MPMINSPWNHRKINIVYVAGRYRDNSDSHLLIILQVEWESELESASNTFAGNRSAIQGTGIGINEFYWTLLSILGLQ